MIVWGGRHSQDQTILSSGAIFDPVSNVWSQMTSTGAPSARYGHAAVWTGGKMIIWAGTNTSGVLDTGSSYDPFNNSWQPLTTNGAPAAMSQHSAIWTGKEMIVWGYETGAIFTPSNQSSADTWTATSMTNVPSERFNHSAVWTGSQMIIWGGVTTQTITQAKRVLVLIQ